MVGDLVLVNAPATVEEGGKYFESGGINPVISSLVRPHSGRVTLCILLCIRGLGRSDIDVLILFRPLRALRHWTGAWPQLPGKIWMY